mmetsp:Transcript_45146/g.59867  ORF Transcript_45146/g.59867 Transcript_45146/m.59867 type:complete len:96 (+) Transcript_45146:1512-1799(+)
MKIELHKQFRVPVDGLIPLAEEITLKKEKKLAENAPFVAKTVEKDGLEAMGSPAAASPREADDEEEDADAPEISDRKAHKKMVKQQQKEKRQMKK